MGLGILGLLRLQAPCEDRPASYGAGTSLLWHPDSSPIWNLRNSGKEHCHYFLVLRSPSFFPVLQPDQGGFGLVDCGLSEVASSVTTRPACFGVWTLLWSRILKWNGNINHVFLQSLWLEECSSSFFASWQILVWSLLYATCFFKPRLFFFFFYAQSQKDFVLSP